MLIPKEEDFDKVMDDIEALVGDVSKQVNKSNDIIEIMEKKKKSTKTNVHVLMASFFVFISRVFLCD